MIELFGDKEQLATSEFKYYKYPFEFFNPIQSRIADFVESNDNILIATPTGSGKSICAELIMLREIHLNKLKTIYVSPLRSLAQEKFDEWKESFPNLKITICTGDYRLTSSRINEINEADIIVITVEALNSRARNSKSEASQFISHCGAIVIDECFLYETKIRIESNIEVPIGKIIEDDSITHVLAYDEKTGQIVKKEIIRKITRSFNSDLVHIEHEHGNFTCTPNHKIWTKNGYVKAIDLKENNEIKLIPLECSTRKSDTSKIKSVNKLDKGDIEFVYDLEIEHCHNYFAEGVLVSNCHLIDSNPRGTHAECGIMKIVQINPNIRFVALSATLPNVDELAKWLSSITKRKTNVVISNYRPSKLNIHFPTYRTINYSYDGNEESKIKRAIQIIDSCPEDKFLVFAHGKRTGELMLSALKNRKINTGFHNGDLILKDRIKLETDFKTGDLKVLVATSTLAWGCFSADSLITKADGNKIKAVDLTTENTLLSINNKKTISTKIIKLERKVSNGLQIEIADGTTAKVTNDHLFLTDPYFMGFTRADKLTIGKKLTILSENKLDELINFRLLEITSIKPITNVEFIELEVDSPSHVYVGQNLISHNCNLPARRVIILGVHRGKTEVETYDILQEIGRSGRPKFDKEGDAYVLLPDTQALKHKERILKPQPICSQLAGSSVLAFHLISEIHHKEIQTIPDVEKWYTRSFAFSQKGHAGLADCHDAIMRLKASGCLNINGSTIEATSLGIIASMFYFDPFDVSTIAKNVAKNFNEKRTDFLYWVFALSCIPSKKTENASADEQNEIQNWYDTEAKRIQFNFTGNSLIDGQTKHAYILYQLMNGNTYFKNPSLRSIARNIQQDFGRTIEILRAIDNLTGKWDASEVWNELESRVIYGVESKLIQLVRLPGIGKIKAIKLYEAGLTDLTKINKEDVMKVLKCKAEMAENLVLEAKKLILER